MVHCQAENNILCDTDKVFEFLHTFEEKGEMRQGELF